jgi:predicted Zn-dependent protease with MMP-like domain
MSRSVERLLDQGWDHLDGGQPLRARALARRAVRDTVDPLLRAEAFHLLGCVGLERDDPAGALAEFGRARELGGDWADLHYDLGVTHELLGHEAERRECFLAAHERDEAAAPERRPLLDEDELVRVAEELLADLPAELTSKLGHVPILVEERPARHLVEEGFDPRALGLFDGPPYGEQGLTGPALNRIVLYRASIAAVARTRKQAREEVRITLLHETAHFFGLDEEDVARLGLA